MSGLLDVKPRAAIAALKRAGFVVHHVRGSHHILKKDGLRVTIPFHNNSLKKGTLRSIIEQAGLTVDEFRHLL
jgi:predicted RNA binding protein YcfA (HicA-like mRNA interferase family)